MTLHEPTIIRLATKDDLPFIISSWKSALYDIYPHKYCHRFNETYSEYLQSICLQSTIVVSCLQSDPHEIISYLVYTSFRGELVVHFALTKLDARKQGKINELLQFANVLEAPVVFTHPAKNEKAMQHFCSKYIYNPWLLKLLEQRS